MIQRILSFWRWAYENRYKDKTKEKLSNEDKKILSDLSRLTVFLQKIDEEKFDWLMLAAPYVNADYSSSFFIKCLDGFEDKDSIGYVGKIFLKMLSASTPDYDEEHIRSIVKKLCVKDADEICDIYARRGFEFLRDIYDDNHA